LFLRCRGIFSRIQPDFVGKPKPIGYDPDPLFINQGNISIGDVRAHGFHPVFYAGGNRQPNAVFLIPLAKGF
jgi:hypothetical protein